MFCPFSEVRGLCWALVSLKSTCFVCEKDHVRMYRREKGSPATHSSGPRLIIIWHRLLFWVFPFAFLSRPWAPRFIALLTRAASSAFSSRIIRASHSFFLFFVFLFWERENYAHWRDLLSICQLSAPYLSTSLYTPLCAATAYRSRRSGLLVVETCPKLLQIGCWPYSRAGGFPLRGDPPDEKRRGDATRAMRAKISSA